MKAIYEAPEAQIINFRAMQNLAIIEDDVKPPEMGVGSLEDLS